MLGHGYLCLESSKISVAHLIGYEKEMRADYKKYHGQKMPSNSQPLIEAILNLESHHTIADIKTALKETNMPLKPLTWLFIETRGIKTSLWEKQLKIITLI